MTDQAALYHKLQNKKGTQNVTANMEDITGFAIDFVPFTIEFVGFVVEFITLPLESCTDCNNSASHYKVDNIIGISLETLKGN